MLHAEVKSLIICGMHRSGTSMVASAFHNAGLHLGENLLEASKYNPKGYFENTDIINFHNKILDNNNTEWHYFPEFGKNKKLFISNEISKEAHYLVNGIKLKKTEFGWKDPRTTLLLDLWNSVLPNSKYVFVFREPSMVIWSLLRRGDFTRIYRRKIIAAIQICRLWNFYNRQIIRFYRAHPEKCVLIKIPDDVISPQRLHYVSEKVINEWEFTLKEFDFSRSFDPTLLRNSCPQWITYLSNINLISHRTYKNISSLHRLTLFQKLED